MGFAGLLGGSWVVISAVIIRVTVVITHIRGHKTPLITTHEPPSRNLIRSADLQRRKPGLAVFKNSSCKTSRWIQDFRVWEKLRSLYFGLGPLAFDFGAFRSTTRGLEQGFAIRALRVLYEYNSDFWFC